MSEPNPSRMEPIEKIVETTDLLNRELSWLEFNARVLAEAEDPAMPLLERLKFLAIFDSNLDEFFMVRVAGLKQQLAQRRRRARRRTAARRASSSRAITPRVAPLVARQRRLFNDASCSRRCASTGSRSSRWDELRPTSGATSTSVFDARIFPVLTPLAVDPGHPFPYISNLSLNLAVTVASAAGDERPRFARVKVPPLLPRFVPRAGDGARFVPLEEVIARAPRPSCSPAWRSSSRYPFRVTRNTDLEHRRGGGRRPAPGDRGGAAQRRFGDAVRLEVDAGDAATDAASCCCASSSSAEHDVYALRRAARPHRPAGARPAATRCRTLQGRAAARRSAARAATATGEPSRHLRA